MCGGRRMHAARELSQALIEARAEGIVLFSVQALGVFPHICG